MLKIKDWAVDADNCCYIVGKLKQRKTKDGNMEDYIVNPKYYSSLSLVFSYIVEVEKRSIVAENELDLKELASRFEETNNEFRELFRAAMGGDS